MKKFNKNRRGEFNGPGNQLPIKHNQKKPFNPGRYGSVWGSIRFEQEWDRVPMGDATQPVIGRLCLDGKQVELTFTETNKIIDILRDAQHSHNVGVRLGQTNNNPGTRSFY